MKTSARTQKREGFKGSSARVLRTIMTKRGDCREGYNLTVVVGLKFGFVSTFGGRHFNLHRLILMLI